MPLDDDEDDRGSWSSYRRLVVSQLEDLNGKFSEMQETLAAMKEAITTLQAKAGIVGGLGGLLVGGFISWVMGKAK